MMLLASLLAVSSAAVFRTPVETPDSILAEVTAQLRTGGKAGVIYSLLERLEAQILSEKSQQDSKYSGKKQSCDQKAFRNQEVKTAEAALAAASNQITLCSDAEQSSKDKLVINLAEQNQVANQIENTIEARASNEAAYKKWSADTQDLIDEIDDSLTLLNSLPYSPNALDQVAQKTSALLIKSSRVSMSKYVTPFIAALAQLDQYSDSDEIDKVAGLLKGLRQNSLDAQASYDVQETQSIQNFNSIHASLTSESEHLKYEESILLQTISDMVACVSEQQDIYSEAYAKTSNEEDSESLCTSWFTTYEAEIELRNYQLELIAQLRDVIYQRYGESSNSVSDEDGGRETYTDEAVCTAKVATPTPRSDLQL